MYESRQIIRGTFRVSLVVAVLAAAPVDAAFLNYPQWRAQSVNDRAEYIAGAVDSLVLFSDSKELPAYSRHYSECLGQSKMTTVQLAQNLSTFVDGRPELQAKPVQAGLIQYLIGLCGEPPA